MSSDIKWQLAKSNIYLKSSIFKMKLIDLDTLIFHLPETSEIVIADAHLKQKQHRITCPQQPQSLEFVRTPQKNYFVNGCRNGTIIVTSEDRTEHFNLSQGQNDNFRGYINDLLYLPEGRLINCYNNGDLAVWDFSKKQLICPLNKVHKDFTYKLRKLTQSKIVSCGNDGYANLIDLNKKKKQRSFLHPYPVWCSYAFNDSFIASVGLLGKIMFWDIRTSRVVQKCVLEGDQSSFITKLDDNNMVLGDRNQIVKCDMRMMKREILCDTKLNVSAQTIISTQWGGFVCGRGFQINRYEISDQLIQPQRSYVVLSNLMSSFPFQNQENQSQPQQEFEQEEQQSEEQINLQIQEEQINLEISNQLHQFQQSQQEDEDDWQEMQEEFDDEDEDDWQDIDS